MTTLTMEDIETYGRLDRMNRVVFNKDNLGEIREVLHDVLDVFMVILEQPFDDGNCFTYKDVLERMARLDQSKWKDIERKYIKDPYHDYCRGNFTDSENKDAAKVLLDLICLFSAVKSSVFARLQEYEGIFRNLKDERRKINERLHETETKLMEEIQRNSTANIDLKAAQGKLEYFEQLLEQKSADIHQLQRNNTVVLWEREKKKALQNSNEKLVQVMDELEEVKQNNATQAKKIQLLEEQNNIMKIKQEMSNNSKGMDSRDSSHALEDMKRKNFLLERDVMCLENGFNDLQKMYVAVLGGLRTDLHIAADKYRCPETNELTDEGLEQLDNRLAFVYSKAKNAELEASKSEMLPHYRSVPQDIKVKKIRRLSLTKTNSDVNIGSPRPSLTQLSQRQHFMQRRRSSMFKIEKEPSETADNVKAPITNPSLLDESGFNVNMELCREHFPEMSTDLIKSQWDQFKEYDNNGDRCLDFTEVMAALRGMGMKFTAIEAEEAMREIDVDKSQSLDFYEYLLVTDKITRQTGKSTLFKSGVVKTHTKVVAKTCSIQ